MLVGIFSVLSLLGGGLAREDDCNEYSDVSISLLQHDIIQHDLTTSDDGASSPSARFEELAILPSVECVRVISLNGSKALAPLTDELKRLGLWDRTIVQTEQLDPDGGKAGCFRAHVRAWSHSQNCSHLLVLEDDAFFENDTMALSTARAEAFVGSGLPYDMLYLGWNRVMGIGQVQVSEIEGADCAFQLQGGWASTHAYVISKVAMRRLSSIEFEGVALDMHLQGLKDTTFSTIRPMSAFQRYHKTSIEWDVPFANQEAYAKDKANPDYVRNHSEFPTYQNSGYGDMCAM
jgi:GR25 family glycosyltransferase involved in LPS biosynthesis